MRFFRDLSPSAFTAGFVAVLVGFTSSVAIVFQAALAFKATPEMIASWMWALGIGMGALLHRAVTLAAQAGDGGVEHPRRGRSSHGGVERQ